MLGCVCIHTYIAETKSINLNFPDPCGKTKGTDTTLTSTFSGRKIKKP